MTDCDACKLGRHTKQLYSINLQLSKKWMIVWIRAGKVLLVLFRDVLKAFDSFIDPKVNANEACCV